MSLAGVIGYPPKNNFNPDFSEAAKRPREVAWFPFIFRYVPLGKTAFSTLNLVVNSSVVSA